MAQETKSGEFQAELKKRVITFFSSLRPNDKPMSANEFDETLAFVKDVALESWKNGLAAGKKRASRAESERRRSPRATE